MRSFVLEDVTRRPVAEGTELTDGSVAVRFRHARETGTSCYASLGAMQHARLDELRFAWADDDGQAETYMRTAGEALRWLRIVLADLLAHDYLTECSAAAGEWLEDLEAA